MSLKLSAKPTGEDHSHEDGNSSNGNTNKGKGERCYIVVKKGGSAVLCPVISLAGRWL